MEKTIQLTKVLGKYNIDIERYNQIAYLASTELSLYSHTSKLYMGKRFLMKRSLELIKTINNTPRTAVKGFDSLPNLSRRTYEYLSNNLEKQIFINNFIFQDNEQFIHAIESSGITLDEITNLINSIREQKKVAKETNNYELDISNICDLDRLCVYYNFNNKELIVNKISELYSLQYDLLQSIGAKSK